MCKWSTCTQQPIFTFNIIVYYLDHYYETKCAYSEGGGGGSWPGRRLVCSASAHHWPGLKFRILCLEGSVISFISPSPGGYIWAGDCIFFHYDFFKNLGRMPLKKTLNWPKYVKKHLGRPPPLFISWIRPWLKRSSKNKTYIYHIENSPTDKLKLLI